MKRQDKAFLMDGDALIIPQKRLMWILDRINEHLPWVKRVGAYANAKSMKMKTPDELVQLREKGLGILYYGVETGDGVEQFRHVIVGLDLGGKGVPFHPSEVTNSRALACQSTSG